MDCQNTAEAQLVNNVTFAPPTIVGGQSTAGSINLVAPWDITLTDTATISSDNTAVTVPGTITLTANALSFPFTVTTHAVSSTQVAHITVNLAGTISVGTRLEYQSVVQKGMCDGGMP